MALIKCPECGKEVSNKAKMCIHCGYPINEYLNEEKTTLSEEELDNFDSNLEYDNLCPKCYSFNWSYNELTGEVVCNTCQCAIVVNEKQNRKYNAMKKEENVLIPKCPTCGSINISKIGFGESAVSIIGFGIFSKKINKTMKCQNCGYMW